MKLLIKTAALIAILSLSVGMSEADAQDTETKKPTITITEYSDYQCPACAYYNPIVKKLKDKYGDQINLKLRFYPLNSHQFAALAARAAQAAKNQGKFLEMHNMLYKNQKRWSESVNPIPTFKRYAKKLNLDMEQFKSDLNDAETQRIVMNQKQEGMNMGVNSTPTFFIEGEKLTQLPQNYEEFEKVVEKYLGKKEN
ncbi:Thioredoxin [Fodinibius salinus]|uniref:Thioredoxin n=1 Tax=Fodinibius salinus TaxID=860790 RepID=A0A5D3YMH7_9BACT|nr:thioredoxin domain-containing protein [Fodinibius salinus]TYP93897.1 Thioredoxin [Fodinibius salinus]